MLSVLNHIKVLKTAAIVLPSATATGKRGWWGALMDHDLNIACFESEEEGRIGGIHWSTPAKIFVATVKLASRSLGPHNLKSYFQHVAYRSYLGVLETFG